MERVFLTTSLSPLLEALAPFGEIHGPVLNDDDILVFGPVQSPADLRLDYQRTLLPPKKYLLPPRETILDYSPQAGYRYPRMKEENIVLFGLHPCDLSGIRYLDHVFLVTETDALYQARRNRLTLVGISCTPDEYCFCGDVGATGPLGFDLFLHSTESGWLMKPGTSRGEEIVARLALPSVEEELPSPCAATCDVEEAILSASRRGEIFPDSPLWDDFASRCLSCGACSLCCPTCYCFDVREYGDLNGETAQRIREWDNCLFGGHGVVAGGFNFRKGRRERFHYRYRHKYLGFGPTRGIVACVGCGRCREVCPVRIDLLELFSVHPEPPDETLPVADSKGPKYEHEP